MNSVATAKPNERTLAGTVSDSVTKMPGSSRKNPADSTALKAIATGSVGDRAKATQAAAMPNDTLPRNRTTFPGPLAISRVVRGMPNIRPTSWAAPSSPAEVKPRARSSRSKISS